MVGILSHLKKMKELINEQTILSLKKSRRFSILCIILAAGISFLFMVPLFIFATRELRFLFIILLSIIGTSGASTVLLIFVVSIMPLNNYIKLSNLSLSGNKFSTKGLIESINEKVTHYKGVAVREIRVKDLEEENKIYIFYVEQNLIDEFSFEKEYKFVTYQSVVMAYEVIH